MDIDFIEQLIELAKKTGVAGLEYEADGHIVRISVADGEVSVSGPDARQQKIVPAADAGVSGEPAGSAPHRVTCGMAGTFYRASAPGAVPYVNIGDRIEEGQVLGLIEAMKMLTPIEADRAGRVAAIKVEDAGAVERGTLLFEIDEAN